MRKRFMFLCLVVLAIVSACATTSKKDPGLITSSDSKSPKWVRNMRQIKSKEKSKVYFYGIGENQSERLANEEAARDAALQFSRYIMTNISSKEIETDTSLNEISSRVSSKINTQITVNNATHQYLVEKYIERRFKMNFDQRIEFYKIYGLYSFPKLQSIEILKDVTAFLKTYSPKGKSEEKYIKDGLKALEKLTKSFEKDEAILIETNRE